MSAAGDILGHARRLAGGIVSPPRGGCAPGTGADKAGRHAGGPGAGGSKWPAAIPGAGTAGCYHRCVASGVSRRRSSEVYTRIGGRVVIESVAISWL